MLFRSFALIVGVGVATLASCNKDAITSTDSTAVDSSLSGALSGTSITSSALPTTAKTYLSTKFSGYSITSATTALVNGATVYEATVVKGTDEQTVVFNGAGAYMGLEIRGAHGHHCGGLNGGFSIDSLSSTIKTYIASHYPGDTIKRAERRTRDSVTTYAVLIDNGTRVKVLIFSATGVFLRESTYVGGGHRGGGGHGGGQGGGHGQDDQISIDSLPQSIPLYITATYAGYTIERAEKERNRSTGVITYEVAIMSGTTRKVLIFDATGAFLRVK